MKLLKTLAFVCLCVPMWGQGYRYDSNAFTSANNVPPGSQSTLFTIPFAKITVCAYPDNGGQPCTNTVPIYQDPALTVTAQNPITADVHGRFGFWKAAGFYTFSVVSPGGEFLGTYIISLGGAGGATTLALTTTGTSGPSTLTGDPAAGYTLNVPNYAGGSSLETQTNGVENLSQTLLDLVQGNNVTLTNTSGGHVRVDSSVTGAFQQQVIPPVTGQYVVIYPTSVVASGLQRATAVTTPGSIGAQLSFRIGCGGLAPCSAVFTWSGFTLPSYVNPANVTAVYTFGNYAGSEIILSHSIYQSSGPSGDAFPSSVIPAIAMQQSTELTAMTGAQVTGSSIQWTFGRTLNVPIGIIPSVNIASVGMIVYYTGPAPPTNTAIIVDPPLFLNGTSLDLGIDPLSINFLQPLLVQHLPDPTLSTGDIYQVTDGTSSSDCTTGGGSTVNLCRSNGTIWSVYSSGGGSGTVSGQANGVIPLATASTTIGAQSHLDDGVTTAATITSSEPIAVAGSTHGIVIPAGPAVVGAAGKVIYASDATSGFAEVNENNTGLSRVCTQGNAVCSGSSFITSLTTTGSSGAATVSSGVLNVPIYSGGGGNTTSTALTTNVLPKANGANSVINSGLTDSGSTLSYAGSGSTNAIGFPASSVAITPIAANAIYGSDASGNAAISENGLPASRPCTASNSVCAGTAAYVNITGAVTATGCTVSAGKCVVGSAVATLSFSSIPGTYNNLKLSCTYNSSSSAQNGLYMQFNGDTAADYVSQLLFAFGTTASALGSGAVANASFLTYPGSTSGNSPAVADISIPLYAGTTFTKTAFATTSRWSTSTQSIYQDASLMWLSTSAITSLSIADMLGGNIVAGSTCSIYGVQ